VVINIRTMGQPGIDAHNRRRQHDYALEKRFRGKAWPTRIAMTVHGMVDVNTYLLWTRALGKRADSMKEFFAQLSMEIISSADVPDSVPISVSTVQRTVSHTAPSPGRRSSPRLVVVVAHVALLYYQAGKKSGYQRHCVICKEKTTSYCSICGETCAIHPRWGARARSSAASRSTCARARRTPHTSHRRRWASAACSSKRWGQPWHQGQPRCSQMCPTRPWCRHVTT